MLSPWSLGHSGLFIQTTLCHLIESVKTFSIQKVTLCSSGLHRLNTNATDFTKSVTSPMKESVHFYVDQLVNCNCWLLVRIAVL